MIHKDKDNLDKMNPIKYSCKIEFLLWEGFPKQSYIKIFDLRGVCEILDNSVELFRKEIRVKGKMKIRIHFGGVEELTLCIRVNHHIRM